jgi:hypothetical protein
MLLLARMVCWLEMRLRDAEVTEHWPVCHTTPPERRKALSAVALMRGRCRHRRRWSGWTGYRGDIAGARHRRHHPRAWAGGSRGVTGMTVCTCTPSARCRIFRATGFHVTSAAGWHGTSSCNTWSGMRRTIGSCRRRLRPRVLSAMTATGVLARLPARFPRGWSWWPPGIPGFHICRDGLAHSMDPWFIRWNTAIRSRITTRTC